MGNCGIIRSEPLSRKGVGLIVDCRVRDGRFRFLRELVGLVKRYFEDVSSGVEYRVFLHDNEPIDEDYILYRFHILVEGSDKYISARIVSFRNIVERIIFVVDKDLAGIIRSDLEEAEAPNIDYREVIRGRGTPPGQKYIPGFIIYRILGQPEVKLDKWFLEVGGLVEKPLKLTYDELIGLGTIKVKLDFHCVTGWSVRGVEWEGVPVRKILDMAGIREEARWVYAVGLDGYSAIIPLRDILVEDALVVTGMNNERLSLEQGFPARLFIPHLYGWKGVKWLHRLLLTDKYRDGYWEALGYHPRGNIWLNERFKR